MKCLVGVNPRPSNTLIYCQDEVSDEEAFDCVSRYRSRCKNSILTLHPSRVDPEHLTWIGHVSGVQVLGTDTFTVSGPYPDNSYRVSVDRGTHDEDGRPCSF